MSCAYLDGCFENNASLQWSDPLEKGHHERSDCVSVKKIPKKAARNCQKTTNQRAVTTRPGTIPPGSISAWKSRMLTISGPATVNANGTVRGKRNNAPAINCSPKTNTR